MSNSDDGLNPTAQKRAYPALALGVLCIGSSPLFIRWANVNGSISAFFRMLISFLLLAAFALLIPHMRRKLIAEISAADSSLLIAALAGGAVYAVENALYNQAILETTATNAVLLTNLSTIWVAVGAFLVFGEKLLPRFWLGVIVALAGVALVVDIDLRRFALSNTGDLMAIGSSFLYAAYMLITQRTREKVSAYLYLVLTMLSASVVLFFLSIFQGFDLLGLAPRSYLNLFLVALIGQTVGFLSINFAQGYIPATRVAIFLLAQPVVILILGYFLLFEYPSLPQLLGVGIVLSGIYIVNRREKSMQ